MVKYETSGREAQYKYGLNIHHAQYYQNSDGKVG